MSKRSAEYQLTVDNYAQEDEDKNGVEEKSSSEMATPEVMKNRVVLKAKRRNLNDAAETSTSSVFSGFKGFQSVAKNPGDFGFNFGSRFATSTTSTFTFGSNNNTNADINKDDSGKTTSISTTISSISESDPDKTKQEEGKTNPQLTFISNLAKLNDSFFEHIKKYSDNHRSIYDFSLVCEEYISKCKKLRADAAQEEKQPESAESKSNQNEKLFSFGDKSSTSSFPSASDYKPPPFVFKTFPIPTSLSHQPDKKETKTANAAAPNGDDGGGGSGDAADQDEQPPKVVSIEHGEEDSVYTKRCKLYYKKEDNFVEKGVGFLYIKLPKEVEDAEDGKTRSPQLLIRADTQTGNILLNIALIPSLPISKVDSNKGVMLTCVANPPIDKDDTKTFTFLIRVKSTDCEELYQNLIKYRK